MRALKLESHEKLIVYTRKHWFVLLLRLLPLGLLAWVPSLLIATLAFLPVPVTGAVQLPIDTIISSPYTRVLYGFWLLMLWSAGFNEITRYYLNEWIITSLRIVQVRQYGFFSREISSLLLVKVQDVDVDVQGIFGTLLDYGELQVQSAGATEHFIMTDVPNPNHLREIIMKEISLLHGTNRTFVNSATSPNV